MYIYIYIFNIEKTVLDIKLKDSPNNPLKDPRFMIFQTPDAGPPLHPFPIPNHQVNKNSFPYHAQEVCRRHDHMDMSPMWAKYATQPHQTMNHPRTQHNYMETYSRKMVRWYGMYYIARPTKTQRLWPLTVKSSFTSRLTWLNTLWMSTNRNKNMFSRISENRIRILHFIIFHPLVHHLPHEMTLLRQNHIKKRHRNHRILTCHLQELCGFSHGGRTWVFWTWNSSAFESRLGI